MPILPISADSPQTLAAAPGRTIVYKHSPTCSLCSWSIEEVADFAESAGVTVHQVDVLRQRQLSQAIEAHFGVRHESPQVLIIDDGRVTWHGSHRALSADRLLAAASGDHSALGSRF